MTPTKSDELVAAAREAAERVLRERDAALFEAERRNTAPAVDPNQKPSPPAETIAPLYMRGAHVGEDGGEAFRGSDTPGVQGGLTFRIDPEKVARDLEAARVYAARRRVADLAALQERLAEAQHRLAGAERRMPATDSRLVHARQRIVDLERALALMQAVPSISPTAARVDRPATDDPLTVAIEARAARQAERAAKAAAKEEVQT